MPVTGWLVWPVSRERRPLQPVAEVAFRLLARLSRSDGAVSVSPISAAWLAEHDVVSSKRQDEGTTS